MEMVSYGWALIGSSTAGSQPISPIEDKACPSDGSTSGSFYE